MPTELQDTNNPKFILVLGKSSNKRELGEAGKGRRDNFSYTNVRDGHTTVAIGRGRTEAKRTTRSSCPRWAITKELPITRKGKLVAEREL